MMMPLQATALGKRYGRWDGTLARTRLARLGIPLGKKVGALSGGQRAQVAPTLCWVHEPRGDNDEQQGGPMSRRIALSNVTKVYAAASLPPPLIQIDHVSRVLETRGRWIGILDDVTCVIPAQSLFSIVGPSGSGKSTLLNMLTGIDRPTSGRIVFGGEPLCAMSENALARWRGRHIGIVFQFFQLLPTLTALENVLLALELGGAGGLPRREWRERALACLKMACVQNLATRLPGELSGGEQQRVAIARALANDPPVLVADEPTGNLDSRTAYQVFETLAGLRHQGKTIIYVTHDHTLAMQATAGIELRDGRIVGETQASVSARQSYERA